MTYMLSHTIKISLALFWLGLIAVTALLLLPLPYLPAKVFSVWDKALHALSYAGLALAGLIGWEKRRIFLIIGLFGHGAVIELTQYQLGWRHGDLVDWIADAVGIIVACALMRGFRHRVTVFQ